MSVVWRAHDHVLGRQVAVKVLSNRYAGDRESRQRIRAEAQAAALLSHPNVTNVYDYGESVDADGHPVPFVVMELVQGSSLAARLADGPLPWSLAVRICAQVAAGLGAAHARGLVHRDVKPANVMLTAAGVKVVDFGIAAVAGEEGDYGPDGTLVGTPAYLAPERLTGGRVAPASDVYALGVLLYRALTGGLPWPAGSTTEMISSHRYVEPRPLPPIDGLPVEVAELCRRCLAKEPAERPTSRELAGALTLALGLRVVRPASPPSPPRTPGGDDPLLAAVTGNSTMDDAVLAGAALDETVLVDPALAGPQPGGEDATGETALVPAWSGGTVHPGGPHRRMRRLAVAGAALLGLGGLTIVLNSVLGFGGGHRDGPPVAAIVADPEDPVNLGGPPQSCQVRYQTRADAAGVFTVELTIRNDGPAALVTWRLTFTFLGDQRILSTRSAVLGQPGPAVVLHDDGANGVLANGQSVAVAFTGEYRAGNPLPTDFRLNDVSCWYVLIGATGETIGTGGPPPPGNLAGPGGEIVLPGSTPMPTAPPTQPAPTTGWPSPSGAGVTTTPGSSSDPGQRTTGARPTRSLTVAPIPSATRSRQTYR
jgi:hypothetical protein